MSELTRRTKIVKEISKLISFDCSLGVTGSTANGVPNKNSDIDLFVVIDSEKINELVRIIYNLNTFQLPSSKVLSGFKNGAIDVIFLYGEIDDIQVNFEIYSLKSVEKLLKLLPITITRFRTRPTADSLFFSSSSGKFIPVTMKKQPFAEGFLSSLPGSIKRRKITYIGNHLRKLLFSKMYKDKKYIGKLMNECFSYFVRDALSKNKFSDLMFVNLSVFDKENKMNKELCAGGILFRKSETGEVKYLLIQSKSWKNWAFPKGHVEENESKEQAAIREIFEETGLNIELLPGFAEGYEYEFDFQGKHIKKEVVFFLAEAKESSIKLNEQEHQEHSWLSYDKAIGLVTHKEDKEVLKKANQFLSGKNE